MARCFPCVAPGLWACCRGACWRMMADDWASKEKKLKTLYKAVVGTLGEGGFGRAYRVIDKSGADKVVKINLVADESLQAEYNDMRWLRHPNIPHVYSFFKLEGSTCIEMDYCKNGDLDHRIRRGPYPTNKEMACWFHGILSALSHIHSFKVIHRDVKPANVLFDHGGKPLLADFGIAVTVEKASPAIRAGTPGYEAPEIVRGGTFGTKADVWSFSRVVRDTATKDPSLEELPIDHVDSFIRTLYKHSGEADPMRRFRAALLRDMLKTLVVAQEQGVDLAPPGASSSSSGLPGNVEVSSVLRAQGLAEVVEQGRTAQKRIHRAGPGEATREDKHARNQLRKARRKAAKLVTPRPSEPSQPDQSPDPSLTLKRIIAV